MIRVFVILSILVGYEAPAPKFKYKTGIGAEALVGDWVKEWVTQEGGKYPKQGEWQLNVAFLKDKRFVWKSLRTEKREITDPVTGKKELKEVTVDCSLKGTYSAGKAHVITFKFDPPSTEAKDEPYLFAYWPNQRIGKMIYRFQEGGGLWLANEGGKLHIFLKPVKK